MGNWFAAKGVKSEDLFKLFDLHFADEDLDGLARLSRYLSVAHELTKTSVFCVRGIHQCFSDAQISELGKELEYKGSH